MKYSIKNSEHKVQLIKKHQSGSYIRKGEEQNALNKDYTDNPFNLEKIKQNILNLGKIGNFPLMAATFAAGASPVIGSGLPFANLIGGSMGSFLTLVGNDFLKNAFNKHPLTGRVSTPYKSEKSIDEQIELGNEIHRAKMVRNFNLPIEKKQQGGTINFNISDILAKWRK